MAGKRAVVLLHPLGLSDEFPHRSLTFTSDLDRVDIGRASKRENKNLAPALHNALFDSRVMSRNHAWMRVSLEKKHVYIHDPGSMHGTWLNKKKIPIGVDIKISDGDVLTFGVEVIRGSDSFPPFEVRCECQWLETAAVDVWKPVQANNTFCVPDDEDDCEMTSVASHGPFNATLDHDSQSSDSRVSSDSEDNRSVVEVSSAMTSPLKSNNTKDAHCPDSSAVPRDDHLGGSPQSPIDLSDERPEQSKRRENHDQSEEFEQPLATPRMTPPSLECNSEDERSELQYYDECFAHSLDEDEDSNIDSEEWELDGQEENEIYHVLYELAPRQSAHNSQVPKEVLSTEAQATRDMVYDDSDSEDELEEGFLPEEEDEQESVRESIAPHPDMYTHLPPLEDPASTHKVPDLVSQKSEQRTHSEALCPAKLPPCWTLDKPISNAGPSFQPSGKLLDHPLTTVPHASYIPTPADLACHLPKYPYEMSPLHDSYIPHTHYADGPFASSQPVMGAEGTRTSKHFSSPDLLSTPFMDPLAPMLPRISCPANASTSAVKLQTSNADTVSTTVSLKRKASEFESDLAKCDQHAPGLKTLSRESSALPMNEPVESADEEPDLPHAQPQNLPAVIDNFDSQLVDLSVSDNSQEHERPAKRVKSSHKRSFGSHAATAIIGAVVGAVGTIAALVSLPPDYFA